MHGRTALPATTVSIRPYSAPLIPYYDQQPIVAACMVGRTTTTGLLVPDDDDLPIHAGSYTTGTKVTNIVIAVETAGVQLVVQYVK
jgi:hypothetical protein